MTLIFRPDRDDLCLVGLVTARVVAVVSAAMLVPATFGLLAREPDAAAGLVIGACVGIIPWLAAEQLLRTDAALGWSHGMVASGLSWLLAPFVGAIPLLLSGHFAGYLDAYFDAMSAFTTTGLAVISDLDHLADATNLWRHLMHFLGGQGLILLVLAFFAGGGGAVGMYAGEAREDKILPHVTRTAQFIWRASLVYFAVGTAALTAALTVAGLTPTRALFHAVNLFFAAFDTGGFAPTSASVALYHSALVEAVLAVVMVAGAISFVVHHEFWYGHRSELVRNLESRVLLTTLLGFLAVTVAGLATAGVYTSFGELFRRGWFQVLSAHTGTGFATVSSQLFATGWGAVAPIGLIMAMTIGGMSGSTTGGIKAIRVGLVAKSVRAEMRRSVLPARATVVETYHHRTLHTVQAQAARAATTVLLLYLVLYLAGTVAGLYYGYPFEIALFESTSAAAAVGLSAGVTSPTMAPGLQIVYIAQMWLGRLEFIAGLALCGFVWSMLRSHR